MEHIFHAVTVSEETGSEKLATDTLSRTLERLGNIKPEVSMFVGCDLANEIALANLAKMITVRAKTGANRTSTPKSPNEKPTYEITQLSDILEIVGRAR